MDENGNVLDLLKTLTQERREALRTAEARWRAGIVHIMSKVPEERGATTYQIAEAAGLSRQQLHQIYRDETGKPAVPDNE